jgi:hypothetical protein
MAGAYNNLDAEALLTSSRGADFLRGDRQRVGLA